MELNSLNLNYWAIAPEAIVSLAAVLIMLVDAFSKKGARQINAGITLVGLALALVAVAGLGSVGKSSYFSGMVVVDSIRIFFSVTILIVSIVSTLLASQFLRDEALPPGEFFALILFATVGMLLLAGAGDLVTVFLGLEIASITTYVMAGYRRYDARSSESSLKYFLLGSFATAFLLYGMALVYGATKTTSLAGIKAAIAAPNGVEFPALLMIGAALMLIGFGFKIASAPFHLWTPDVYEGAPTIVTGFMGTAPKAAVFAAFLHVFAEAFNATGALGSQLHNVWVSVVAIIAALTMTIGNIVALSQKNIKRMLAYSSIAHAGYALVGFVSGEASSASVAFYMLVYSLMSVGAFAVIQLLARAGDQKVETADYAGIGFQTPALSFALAIFLFSLAGIPPTAGFMSKFFIFKSAWDGAPALRWLVVVAVINSIISVYYYLYPIVVMFFRPLAPGFVKPRVSAMTAVALILALIGTLYLGILPNRVMSAIGSGKTAHAEQKQSPQAQVSLK
ncbi:MAG: NADH-quinone oxidoreductase subunit N [Blastocatellia bacterium]